jgi:DNA-binding NarL/FixJ family response regulator
MPTEPIRILVVDDHIVARLGVRLMLVDAPDLCVLAEAGDAAQALALAGAQQFDVALLDITLPGCNGLELLQQLRAAHPRMAVLMLSAFDEEIYAIRALKLGAAGYLCKSCAPAVLVDAVRRTAAGGRHISAALGDKLAGLIGHSGAAGHAALSNRELEVFKRIAAGDSLVHIGDDLKLSPNTVATYRSRILDKLQASSNAELTRYALEHGLL